MYRELIFKLDAQHSWKSLELIPNLFGTKETYLRFAHRVKTKLAVLLL